MTPPELLEPLGAVEKVRLTFLRSHLDLIVAEGVQVDDQLDFFRSHFRVEPVGEGAGPAAATIVVGRLDEARFDASVAGLGDGSPGHIRKSSSPFFTVATRAFDLGGGDRLLRCETSGSVVGFDPASRTVTVGVTDGRPGRELLELIRDLLGKDAENRGIAVLHAAAVELDGIAIALVGAKGAGKSSVALELVLNHGGRLLSGDKTHVWLEDGALRCAGWPDWPHLGLGTISRFEPLTEAYDLAADVEQARAEGDLWSTRHKRGLDPGRYATVVPFAAPGATPRLAAFVLPAVADHPETVVDAVAVSRAVLRANLEPAFTAASTWNPIPEPDPHRGDGLDALLTTACTVPCFAVRGSGTLAERDLDRIRLALASEVV